MSRITFFPLYQFYFKYLGLMSAITGIILFLLVDEKAEILIYFGLLIIAFSKEKNENPIIINIRNDTFKSVFGFYISLMIALNVVSMLSSNFQFSPTPVIYLGLPLILYLIVFYISVIFKIILDPSLEIAENIVNNKKLYTIWSILILLITLGLAIIKIMD